MPPRRVRLLFGSTFLWFPQAQETQTVHRALESTVKGVGAAASEEGFYCPFEFYGFIDACNVWAWPRNVVAIEIDKQSVLKRQKYNIS